MMMMGEGSEVLCHVFKAEAAGSADSWVWEGKIEGLKFCTEQTTGHNCHSCTGKNGVWGGGWIYVQCALSKWGNQAGS